MALLLAASAAATTAEAGFTGRQRVATGLAAPMYSTFAPGQPNYLFIAERGAAVGGDAANATANIRVLNLTTGTLQPTPFLSITGLNINGEGGLLGMAFHPDYANNGKFYVNVTANDSISGTPFSSYIREYTATPGSLVANSGFTPVMTFAQPQSNHNGGWIGFSPNDGYLYIMTGDGGLGNDQGPGHIETGNPLTSGNALNLDSQLGKVLRVDVDDIEENDDFPGDAARNYRVPDSNPFADVRDEDRVVTSVVPGNDEIWAYGLRNPFRAGFDRATGDLWIGDVGQDRREEVDFQPGDSAGGENYGWRRREGKIATPTGNPIVGGPPPPGAVEPIWDYKRSSNDPEYTPADANFLGTTVIGGVPYRGPDPTLQGLYFFTDNGSNRIWTLQQSPGGGAPTVAYVTPSLPTNIGSPASPSSISEDAYGNIYITYLSGAIYRIVTDQYTPGDFNGDAKVDDADLAIFNANLGTSTGATRATGDTDGDGDVDGTDFLRWQQNFGWSSLNVGSPLAVIPEPASAGLFLVAAALAAHARRRRRA